MNEEILAALNWRYATKQFDATKKISSGDWNVLKEALINSPSSFGLQPWRFINVENPEIRAKLRENSWGQSQVTDASHYVVFTTLDRVSAEHVKSFIKRIEDVRSLPAGALNDYENMMLTNVTNGGHVTDHLNWTRRQAYIAMGFLLETAALLKIDATPMEGLDALAYDEILGLNGTGWKTVASVAIGYRHPDDQYQQYKKVRFAESEVIKTI